MAYNLIPKRLSEIPQSFTAQRELFTYLTNRYTKIADPIAIDRAYPNRVKVTRALTGYYDLKDFKPMQGKLYQKWGEGSRGNRGANNSGNQFERSFIASIRDYNSGDTEKVRPERIEAIKEIYRISSITSADVTHVAHEGGRNTPRTLRKISAGLSFGTSFDIGADVSDVTINKNIYLSLKEGTNFRLVNAGLGKLHKNNPDIITELYSILGVDPSVVANAIKGKHVRGSEDPTIKPDLSKLTSLLRSAHGHGYIMVHGHRSQIDVRNITKADINKLRVTDAEVVYSGKSGRAKLINIKLKISSTNDTYSFTLRDSHGGHDKNFPSILELSMYVKK